MKFSADLPPQKGTDRTEARHDEDLGDFRVPGPPGMRHHHPHEVLGGRELVPSRCFTKLAEKKRAIFRHFFKKRSASESVSHGHVKISVYTYYMKISV